MKRYTTKDFILKAMTLYDGKYDYSKVEYINNHTKVCIICPEHGEFWQTPNSHLNGQGCPKCSYQTRSLKLRLTKEQFIERSKKIHNNKYDYSKAEYINNHTKVCIICPVHGEFWQTPDSHLNGRGCPKCRHNFKMDKDDFIKKAIDYHGNKYDYSKVNYVNNKAKVCIICPEHGEFWQTPNNHLNTIGCPKCKNNAIGLKKRSNTFDFTVKSNLIFNNYYDYSKVNYVNNSTKVCIICPKHGEFWQTPSDHLIGCGCPKCGVCLSKAEDQIVDFLKNIHIENIIQSDRTILKPKELDIYVPAEQIAIEYDGLRWHSELFSNNAVNNQLAKTNDCNKKGIRLIHIFEDEWLEKPQIVKSMLRNILGKTSNRLYARQCEIRDVDTRTAMQFLDDNHIQGRCKAKYHYGLYHDGELVSLMTFGNTSQQRKYNEDYDNTWELLRFCNKLDTSVVGGASKLLKHFIGEVKPHMIMTYADKRWSVGKLYERLGFTYTHDSKPNYFYVVGQHRENRFKYRKGELVKQGFDPDKSEHEIMLERGIPRIYDCGTMAFEMKL